MGKKNIKLLWDSISNMYKIAQAVWRGKETNGAGRVKWVGVGGQGKGGSMEGTADTKDVWKSHLEACHCRIVLNHIHIFKEFQSSYPVQEDNASPKCLYPPPQSAFGHFLKSHQQRNIKQDILLLGTHGFRVHRAHICYLCLVYCTEHNVHPGSLCCHRWTSGVFHRYITLHTSKTLKITVIMIIINNNNVTGVS